MNRESTSLVEHQLTACQQAIVDDETYPNFVIASAGTGKTEMIVSKVIKIIMSHKASLENIAIITFTNKATAEMQQRIKDRLYKNWLIGHDDFVRQQIDFVNLSDISTIHAFCEKIIRQYSLEIGLSPNFVIKGFKSELDKAISIIISQFATSELINNVSIHKLHGMIKNFYEVNSNNGRENIDLDESLITQSNTVVWARMKNLFMEMYFAVEEELKLQKRKQNTITPNDLIMYASKLLAINGVAQSVSRQYKYVFIDEMQDTNLSQYTLIKAMIEAKINVFVVGDEKQSIYSFRGANVKSFRKIVQDIRVENNFAQSYVLCDNFRTDKELLDSINKIFSYKFQFYGQNISLNNPSNTKISQITKRAVTDLKPMQLHYNMSVVELINLSKGIHKIKKTVVLCRNNFQLGMYEELLRKKNIPVSVVGGKSFYKSVCIIDTYKIINALVNCGVVEQTELVFTDYYAAYLWSGRVKCDFTANINNLRSELRLNSISQFLHTLCQNTSIIEYYNSLGDEQNIANIYKLIDIAQSKYSEGISQTEFLNFLDVMITSSQEEDQAALIEDGQAASIILTTIHRAKGLSFDCVIVPEIDNQLMFVSHKPELIYNDISKNIAIDSQSLLDRNSNLEEDSLYKQYLEDYLLDAANEELRVMYVAFTRVKNLLILGTKTPKSQIIFRIEKHKDYHSYYKWLHQIDKGKFISGIEVSK